MAEPDGSLASAPQPPKPGYQRVLGVLSNGFVLLLFGSLITSVLVPHYQRLYEDRRQRSETRKECLRQFFLASNLIWQEYFLLAPVTQKATLSADEYSKLLGEINAVRVKRYDAFATVEALAVAYRDQGDDTAVEAAIHKFAVRVNQISHQIDTWIRSMRCAGDECDNISVEEAGLAGTIHQQYLAIQSALSTMQDEEQAVGELMVHRLMKTH